jgi:hypothetical protein
MDNTISRRNFLSTAAGAALAGSACRRKPGTVNLVPAAPGKTPSYWCTWGVQNYSLVVPDELSHSTVANNLTERQMFGEAGWAKKYLDKVRGDLYIVYDLGWDVPPGLQFDKERWRLGTLEVATGKFPSCTGSPEERLRKLNGLTKSAGWRGAGIWVPAQAPGDGRDGGLIPAKELEEHFRTRLRWSRAAGIEYWKVDYGARAGDADFRRMLTRLAREEAPGLRLEHGRNCGPLNDEEVGWEKLVANRNGSFRTWDNGRILAQATELMSFSDVLRTYDVTAHFSMPTTLDRVAQLLAEGTKQKGNGGLINCEDEPYIAAALGCAMGVLRHPQWREYKGRSYDPYQVRKRIDEVTRAVRWQRIAPAFGVGEAPVTLDTEFLLDRWRFGQGETWAWWVIGKDVVQGAPARVARGMALPEVKADKESPFVAASRHPNGAVAVATLPRISVERGIHLPLADVTIDIGDGSAPLGVFGMFRSLTLKVSGGLRSRRVWAQDLAGDLATDITDEVKAEGDAVKLRCPMTCEVGLTATTPGDMSNPAMVVKLI